MNIFEKILLHKSLCFDIGANMGNKTDQLLNLGASVVCVEPQLNCIHALNSRFKGNDNVKIVQTALGSENGVLDIFISDSDTLSTMSTDFIKETSKERFNHVTWDKVDKVNVTTIDNLISIYGCPDFCKIDVEGYEVEVLKGLSVPIKYISVEFTPELKDKTFDCINILNGLTEYEYNYSEGESNNFTFENWIDSEEMIEFLKRNNDFSVSFGDLYAKIK